LSQVSYGLSPTDLLSPLHFWPFFHGRTAFGTNRCIHSSQKPAEQVLALGIGPLVVSHLFFYGIRSVVDFPRRSSVALRFWRWNHSRMAFGNNRYVTLSQEPEEQVLMIGINPPVVSHLLCYCLMSVVDSCRRIFGRLYVSCSGITGEPPVGITGM